MFLHVISVPNLLLAVKDINSSELCFLNDCLQIPADRIGLVDSGWGRQSKVRLEHHPTLDILTRNPRKLDTPQLSYCLGDPSWLVLQQKHVSLFHFPSRFFKWYDLRGFNVSGFLRVTPRKCSGSLMTSSSLWKFKCGRKHTVFIWAEL